MQRGHVSIRRTTLVTGVAGLFLLSWAQPAAAACNQAYFKPATKVVLENAGEVTLRVSNPGSTDRSRTVDYRTVAGTAKPGVDYVPESGTLSFSPSVKVRTIHIAIIDDATAGPHTQFQVELIPVQESCITDLGGNATVTIKENDSVVEDEDPGDDDPRPGTSPGPGHGGSGSGGSGYGTVGGSSASTPVGSFSPRAIETPSTGSNDLGLGLPPYHSTIAAPGIEQDEDGGVAWSALAGIALGGIALGGLWVGTASRRKAAIRPPR